MPGSRQISGLAPLTCDRGGYCDGDHPADSRPLIETGVTGSGDGTSTALAAYESHDGGALPSRDGTIEDPTLREKVKLRRREKLRITDSAASMVRKARSSFSTPAPLRRRSRAPCAASESDHHYQRPQHRRRTGWNCRRSNSHWGTLRSLTSERFELYYGHFLLLTFWCCQASCR